MRYYVVCEASSALINATACFDCPDTSKASSCLFVSCSGSGHFLNALVNFGANLLVAGASAKEAPWKTVSERTMATRGETTHITSGSHVVGQSSFVKRRGTSRILFVVFRTFCEHLGRVSFTFHSVSERPAK